MQPPSSKPNMEPCAFCKQTENIPEKWGAKCRKEELTFHENCLLMSQNAPFHRGRHRQDVTEFRVGRIRNTLKGVSLIPCNLCHHLGAATRCQACYMIFHLPCVIITGGMSIYKDNFPTYCRQHRPRQEVPRREILKAKSNPPVCVVCTDTITVDDNFAVDALWGPCCKNSWYHRDCMESMGARMGPSFRCPVCRNKQKFTNWMTKNGIYVWKVALGSDEPAEDLRGLVVRCNVRNCPSPYGPYWDVMRSIWELIQCHTCGSGAHLFCARLEVVTPGWKCVDCSRVVITID